MQWERSVSSHKKKYVHANRPRSIYQYSNMAPRLSGQNCKFFKFLMSLNYQKRLEYKGNNTNYRSLTRKPRSHVRTLIYRMWPISEPCMVRPQLVLTSFNNAPIIASLPTCFISRLLKSTSLATGLLWFFLWKLTDLSHCISVKAIVKVSNDSTSDDSTVERLVSINIARKIHQNN